MEDNADEMIEMKCVIIGSNTVGKTSAIRAFSGHEFLNNNHYEETKDVVTTSIQLKGNDPIVKVTFWDCSPQTFLKSPHEGSQSNACLVKFDRSYTPPLRHEPGQHFVLQAPQFQE